MKALCWMGTGKVEVHNVPDPAILNPHDADHKNYPHCDLRFGFASVRRLHSHHGRRRHPGTRIHGDRRRNWQGRYQPPPGRPRGRALHDRMRQLRFLQEKNLVGMRQHQSERPLDGSCLRIFGLGLVRLFPHDGRICRRPGAVCPGPVRQRRSSEDRKRSCPTKKFCSFPIFSRPATWLRKMRKF